MANPKIFIRRSSTPNKVPTSDQLALGELAINTNDGKLYLEKDPNGVGIGTTVVCVNPFNVGVGSLSYNINFTAGDVGIGTDNVSTAVGSNNTAVLAAGIVTAYKFYGDGSALTNISGGGGGAASVTMSTSAPGSPSSGDLWWDTDIGELYVYYADGSSNQWVETSGGSETVVVSDNAPSSPNGGDLWWESDTGRLKIYYNDGDSAQWIDANGGLLDEIGDLWGITNAGIHTLSNVGIGTTNPTVKLVVDGDARVTGIITATTFVGALTGDVTGNLTGTASNASGATGDFSIADKIVHTGDTNTALRFPAADTITAETGGSEAFRIDSSGRLQIGASNNTGTNTKLVVGAGNNINTTAIINTGDVDVNALTLSNWDGSTTTNKLMMHFDSSGIGAFNIGMPAATDAFVIDDGGTERFRITSGGDVGIGTAIPVAAANYSSLSLVNTAGAQIELKRTSNNTTHYIYTDGSDNLNIGANYSGASTGDLVLRVGGSTERARLTSAGNLGVNNTSPSSKVSVRDTVAPAAYANITPTATNSMLQLYRNTSSEFDNNHSTMQLGVNGGTHNRVCTISAVATSAASRLADLTFCPDDGGSRSEAMRITSDGKIGINETVPDRQLHVKSGANSNDGVIRIESANSNIMDMGTDGTGHFLNCVNADPFRIKFAGTERLRVQSGGGISFNGDTAAANALDDYEEGTWTPDVVLGTVTGVNGHYTKVGRLVTVSGYVNDFSDRSSSSPVRVSGLPFADGDSNDACCGTFFGRYVSKPYHGVYMSSDTLYFYGTVNTNYNRLEHANLSANSGATIYFTATYQSAG